MPFSPFRIALVTSALLLFSPCVVGQDRPREHPLRPKSLGAAEWKPSAQEILAAYWTLEPGWSTELEMRNNLTSHELTVTPILRSIDGKKTPLTPVTIAPQHIVSLDLRKLSNKVSEASTQVGSFGSVGFRFNGLDAANLFAAATVHRDGHPISFHFDADDDGSNYSAGGIEGIWWLPAETSTDYLVVNNPSKKTISGRIVLTSSSGPAQHIPLSLGPGQTNRIDIREVLGTSANGAMGGLSVVLPGKESLSATQFVFDEVTGLTAMMKLFERKPNDAAQTHSLLAPMMALAHPDAALGLPNGTTLIPRIFLRNAAPKPTQAVLMVNWRSATNSATFSLPGLNLASGEVRMINLTDYGKTGQIPQDATWASVGLKYVGRTADLVPVAFSYDKDSRYGLQTPFSEAISRLWAGGMWHVDATHNTLITTGNGGSETTAAEVTLFYNGGKSKYRLERMLAPGEQLWLDVGQLVHNQVPDSDGNTLPPDAMTGSYELRDLDHAYVGQLYEGKLVIDKTYGHAAYGCAQCCGYHQPYFNPSPFGGPPGIDNPQQVDAVQACGGLVDDVTSGGLNWKSSNTAVFTLPTPTLHTVAPGHATGSAVFNLEGIKASRSGDCLTVQSVPQQPGTVITVSFSSIANLQVGQTANITATVTPADNAVPISLSISSNLNVSPTTFTQSTNLAVKGMAVGTATITAQVPNPDGGQPMTAGSTSFQVVAPPPSVSISLQSSGTVSGTNSALSVYQSITGTTSLGIRTSTEAGFKACFGGVQFTGVVSPSNYTGTLQLRRTIESCGTYNKSSNSVSCPTGPEISAPGMRDDSPSTSGGDIFDLDTPGIENGSQANSVYRYRVNFQEYATLPDGTTVVSTAPVNYYVRVSCTFDSSGNPSLDTTVSGDNQIGLGTTATSWNLQ